MTLVNFNRKPLERNLNNVMDEFFSDLPSMFHNGTQDRQWQGIPVNISENEKSYNLEVIAPGFDKADFKVNLEKGIMTVSAEKKEEVKEDGNKQVRREYKFKSFKRSFTLDEKIDADGISAQYVNGVLTLNLPKKEVVKQTKEITIG
jgi:HSP20 family protein